MMMMMMTRRFHDPSRRHPLCPQCRYDLVAAVAANRRICPECGYEFTPSELIRERREGEWTVARGLRNAAIALALRSLILFPLWTLLFGSLQWIVVLIPAPGWSAGGVIILFFLMFIPGLVIGKILSKNLTEIGGFISSVLTAMAGLFAIAVGAGGPLVAHAIHPVSLWHAAFSAFLVAGVASIFIIKDTLVDV